MEDYKKLNKQVIRLTKKLDKLILKEVERRARAILIKHPELKYFMVTMGVVQFTYNKRT